MSSCLHLKEAPVWVPPGTDRPLWDGLANCDVILLNNQGKVKIKLNEKPCQILVDTGVSAEGTLENQNLVMGNILMTRLSPVSVWGTQLREGNKISSSPFLTNIKSAGY